MGNSRVTFSDTPITTTQTATMETGQSTALREEATFENVSNARQTLSYHNASSPSSDEPQPNKVATLNPARGNTVGPAKSLKVYAGDTVRLAVQASYETLSTQKVQGVGGVAAAVVDAFAGQATGIETQGATQALSEALAGSGLLGDDGKGVPRAYLNYLLFDEDYVLLDQGFTQVSREAEVAVQGRSTQVSSSPTQASHQTLTLEVAPEQSGYLYTYLSNESNWDVNVYFDEFTVAQQSYIVQVNDYYPFGLLMSGRNYVGSGENRYLFNGKELQSEWGVYDFGARMYDPTIRRWMSVDPLVDEFPSYSPYTSFNNNPILFIDPDGKAAFNSQGCCGGPVDDLVNYAKGRVRQAAYDLTVAAGKTLLQLGNSYIDYKLDQAVNSDNSFTSSVALTTEFVTGFGPTEREFGGDHPFTQSLAESNMTTEALKAFNVGYQDYLAGDREDIPSSYRVDFSYGPSGDTGPFKEFFKDGKFTAAQFTGTANYTFSLDKGGNLNIGVYDTKTEYSFLYHAPGTDRHSRGQNRIMGETTQYYNFTIPLDQVQKRVEE